MTEFRVNFKIFQKAITQIHWQVWRVDWNDSGHRKRWKNNGSGIEPKTSFFGKLFYGSKLDEITFDIYLTGEL